MLFFDTRLMNLYFIGFFSIAAIAVVLALGVVIAEVMRYRRLRLAQAAMPIGNLGSRLGPRVDVGERLEGLAGDGGKRLDHGACVR
jgi:hypothetical protein